MHAPCNETSEPNNKSAKPYAEGIEASPIASDAYADSSQAIGIAADRSPARLDEIQAPRSRPAIGEDHFGEARRRSQEDERRASSLCTYRGQVADPGRGPVGSQER
jgi:hypothetical protein